jgi:16S rRNA (cytidine1402-2'-O)-methyltransferase
MKGKLFLIPSPLGESNPDYVFPSINREIIMNLTYFIVEDIRTARRFLKKLNRDINIDALQFSILNEHTQEQEVQGFLDPAIDGNDIGLLSEAGTPCIADPGNLVSQLAHQKGIKVVPLIGPNSIMLALMASGFNGQNFIFHGYLPVPKKDRANRIRAVESQAYKLDQTQIFIEAPYRNNQMLESILETCSDETLLCLATNISTDDEMIMSKTVRAWRKKRPELHKKPTVFLIYK